MKTTRRKWLAGLTGLFAAPLAAKGLEHDEIIRAGEPGADAVEVYHADTGAVMDLVQAVCIGKWIERLVTRNGKIEFDYRGNVEMQRIPGNWRVRPKKERKPCRDLTADWKREIHRLIAERRADSSAIHSMPFPVSTPTTAKSWAPTSH